MSSSGKISWFFLTTGMPKELLLEAFQLCSRLARETSLTLERSFESVYDTLSKSYTNEGLEGVKLVLRSDNYFNTAIFFTMIDIEKK